MNRRELIKMLAAGAAIAAGLKLPTEKPVGLGTIVAPDAGTSLYNISKATYPRWSTTRTFNTRDFNQKMLEAWTDHIQRSRGATLDYTIVKG